MAIAIAAERALSAAKRLRRLRARKNELPPVSAEVAEFVSRSKSYAPFLISDLKIAPPDAG
jgi:hypothetical protein